MGIDADDRRAFRCSVAPENSAATLTIGGRKFEVNVIDTSRNGFCVRARNSIAKRIRENKLVLLSFAGERWEVQLRSRYSECADFTNVGLSRVREVSKIRMPSAWTLGLVPRAQSQSDPTFLAFLIIAFFAAVLLLPGLGDKIGTAPKFRKVLNSVIKPAR